MVLLFALVLLAGGAVCWCLWMAVKAACLIAEEHGVVITGADIENAVDRVIRRELRNRG